MELIRLKARLSLLKRDPVTNSKIIRKVERKIRSLEQKQEDKNC